MTTDQLIMDILLYMFGTAIALLACILVGVLYATIRYYYHQHTKMVAELLDKPYESFDWDDTAKETAIIGFKIILAPYWLIPHLISKLHKTYILKKYRAAILTSSNPKIRAMIKKDK